MTSTGLYRQYLKDELARRCEKNPSYSLRAFAKALDVDAGTLSKILSGQQTLSFKMAQRFIPKLELDPAEETQFYQSLSDDRGTRSLKYANSHKALGEREYKGDGLNIDYYRVIADWYHLALLELTIVPGFKPTARYVSHELGISLMEAKLALERLVSLGLLVEKNGRYSKSKQKLSTTDRHLTTPALRKNQRQFLEKAIHSLENDPIEQRSHTNMIMAVNTSKIETAKKMIREFQMALCNYLESGPRDRVFNMSVALFPVQRNKE